MKKIHIFIGSSVDKDEFELERERLGTFINGLNRTLVDKGIFIDLHDCETVSQQLRAEGSQKTHDDYIAQQADAAFFLFFRKAGEFTLHELQLARETFLAKGKPAIFIYFKVVGKEPEQTEGVKKAVDIIANTYGHYFGKFADVDTVKLGMLQYITEALDNYSEITISDGMIMFNNRVVDGIELENIFAYQNNIEYRDLLQKQKELTAAIETAISQKDFGCMEALTEKKEQTEKSLSQLESDILTMLLQMQKQMSEEHREPLIMKAYSLLELGKLREAQALFPIDVLKQKDKTNRIHANLQQLRYQTVIEEAKVRISALKMALKNSERFAQIEETYDAVGESAYLWQQNKMLQAYENARKAEGLLLMHPNLCDVLNRASFYNLLGMICHRLKRKTEETERCYLEGMALLENLAKENPSRFHPDLAVIYNNLGSFYDDHGIASKAEQYFQASLGIRLELAKEDPDRYYPELARSYNNMGSFYDVQEEPEKAIDYLLKAIKILESLAQTNPERFYPTLGECLYNAGVFFVNQNNYDAAEQYYYASTCIRQSLFKMNPDRYAPDLAMSLDVTGCLYDLKRDYDRAEKFFVQALGIFKRLSEDNPEQFLSCFADCHINTGVMYGNNNKATEAEKHLVNALEIYKKLSEGNRERYLPGLANSYYNAGTVFHTLGKPEKAKNCFIAALDIRESLAKENPKRFSLVLARSYNSVAAYYQCQEEPEKAQHYYLAAIDVLEKLMLENRDRVAPDLAIAYFNYSIMKQDGSILMKAYMIAKQYPDNPQCKGIIDFVER